MIHRIYSNLSTFKELSFRSGLNVLLAEKSPEATERHTRNRAGKTSLIELIHFLAGDSARPNSLFRTSALSEYSFGIEFDLGNFRTVVERSGQHPSKITIAEGDPSTWPVKPSAVDTESSNWVITNTNWKIVLGKLMFGLPGGDDEEPFDKFGPKYRSLFAYFVRRQSGGGFLSATKQHEKQQLWDQQVAITYLLGLDWTISQQWQTVREKEKTLAQLRKAAKEGDLLGTIIGTTAELRSELAIAEERARKLEENLKSFRVLPEYRDLEKEASELAQKLGTMTNDNTMDRHLLAELERALEEEQAPSLDDLESLYAEVGIILPDLVVQRFEDVRAFHESVIQNRRSYLAGEVEATEQRISEREQSMRRIAARQTNIMTILGSHGALDQFLQLQSELSRLQAKTESIRQRYTAAEQMEGLKTELDIKRNQLLLRLRQDFREQADTLRQAILAFEEISNNLYEEAGRFTISESTNGPDFEIRIQGEKSKGITNMQIFCFDMMLMQLCGEKDMGPGFLVHDSHLFDGVDERQIARALQAGSKIANEQGFQYIVTMNSDVLPRDYSNGFEIEDYILPTRLTDATEDGGLFGFRFG
jgi:uncharacterized protein YydD (DUF2326 family)